MAFLGQYSPNTYRTNNQFSAITGQTVFYCSYDPTVVDVFRNGVKLLNGQDFTASNGTSVVLETACTAGDSIEVIAYKVNLKTTDNTIGTTAPISVGSSTTLVQGQQYVLTAGNLTLNLPASPQTNWTIRVIDASAATTNVIARNGSNILGAASDLTLDIANSSVTLLYVDATHGWWVI